MKVTSQEVHKRIESAMSGRRCSLVYEDMGKEGARLADFTVIAWFALPLLVKITM